MVMSLLGNGTYPNPLLLIYDSFTGVSGTKLLNHAMDIGTGWISGPVSPAAGGPMLSINASGNAIAFSGGGGTGFYGSITDVRYPNGSLEFTVVPGWASGVAATNPSWPNAIFRFTDLNNYWQTTINSGKFVVAQVVAGVLANVASGLTSTLNGTPFTLKIVMSGASMDFYNGATHYFSVTDSFNQNATMCGVALKGVGQGIDSRSGAYVTNFKFSRL